MDSTGNQSSIHKMFFPILFAIAMAYCEAAVVVYLREVYYPDGFSFPLKSPQEKLIVIEIFREAATLVMLILVSALCGRKFWERFAYFIVLFGIWDVFYYVWLRVTTGWPSSLFEWDILFLIPLPWIGPVIAPLCISLLMIIIGWSIIRLYDSHRSFRPTITAVILAGLGTAVILYSFMHDLDATLRFQFPDPYNYVLLLIGMVFYTLAYLHSYKRVRI
jgi:hypothetical protein